MSKHTPGPWSLADYYEDDRRVLSPDGFSVAEVEEEPILDDYHANLRLKGSEHWAHHQGTATKPIPKEEWEANRSLIAAAPDLLAACREAAPYLDYLANVGISGAARVHDAITAAIAKAEGATQ